jgi:hypothetical protein
MPLPNFHAARVRNPGDFAKIVVLQSLPNGVLVYGGPLKAGPSGSYTAQSYRFPKARFTADQAKAWLEAHKIKIIAFEPAEMSTEMDKKIREKAAQ